MSRLWADRLLISLAPDAIALVHIRRWGAKVLFKKHFPSEKPVEALRSEINALGKERLRATVVLSNRFVRYAVVPFDAAVSGPAEELALARFHFTRIYGERAKTWDLRAAEGPPGAARLACAVDAGLVDAIRGCFPSGSRTRLVSIQPYLMAAYNRWRGTLAAGDAWLVLPEADSACLAYVTHAGWQAARSLRCGGADGPALADGLAREQLRLAGAPRAARVHGAAPLAPAGWTLQRLALPWAAMIRAAEGAAGPDVALLQMEPDARERRLRLMAEARNEQAMLEYLRRLGLADALAEVHLASHQVVLEDPRRPIQFTALARLR